MGQSLNNIRKRLNSIKSTMKITKAMKMVASSKMMKKKRTYFSVQKYNEVYQNLLLKTLCKSDIKNLDVCKEYKDATKDLYVVIYSDVGLCGSYNNQITKYAKEIIKDEDDVLYLGGKGKNIYPNDLNRYENFLINYSSSKCNKLFRILKDIYEVGKYKNIYIVYTHFKNVITFENRIFKMFPSDLSDLKLKEKLDFPPYLYEEKTKLAVKMIERYLTNKLNLLVTGSLLSEESMRRNAMDNATTNADNLIKDLTLQYNKVRQENITLEIQDIVVNSTN